MLVLSILLEDVVVRNDQIQVALDKCDALEVRIDTVHPTEEQIALLGRMKIPLLLTFSDPALCANCPLSPWMVDIPFRYASFLPSLRQLFPKSLVQLSLHLDSCSPQLSFIEEAIAAGCDAIKIACVTSSTLEVLHLLKFLKMYAPYYRLSCIPMGDVGQFGRLLCVPLGSFLSFTCLPERPTAPGQIDIITLHEQYAVSRLSSSTKLFGLIGDPVTKSPSHKTHTRLLQAFGIDGLYVKMVVAPSEYKTAISLLEALEFSGLSVTTPLKQLCGGNVPMNTIVWKHGCCTCSNTDGVALIDAISARLPVDKARILILGAGAVAQAVATALHEKGAILSFWNRTRGRVEQLAKLVNARFLEDLSSCEELVDVIVDTTSARWTEIPFDISFFARCGVQLVAEFSFPERSALLQRAKESGVATIPGYELWVRQAAKQLHLWCDLPEAEVLTSLQRGVP